VRRQRPPLRRRPIRSGPGLQGAAGPAPEEAPRRRNVRYRATIRGTERGNLPDEQGGSWRKKTYPNGTGSSSPAEAGRSRTGDQPRPTSVYTHQGNGIAGPVIGLLGPRAAQGGARWPSFFLAITAPCPPPRRAGAAEEAGGRIGRCGTGPVGAVHPGGGAASSRPRRGPPGTSWAVPRRMAGAVMSGPSNPRRTRTGQPMEGWSYSSWFWDAKSPTPARRTLGHGGGRRHREDLSQEGHGVRGGFAVSSWPRMGR